MGVLGCASTSEPYEGKALVPRQTTLARKNGGRRRDLQTGTSTGTAAFAPFLAVRPGDVSSRKLSFEQDASAPFLCVQQGISGTQSGTGFGNREPSRAA